jgi:membrane-associated phospholipid phosphatase
MAALCLAAPLWAQQQESEPESVTRTADPAPPPAETAPPAAKSEPGIAPTIEPSGERHPNGFEKLLGNVVRDQKAIWTSPFHMKRSDVKWWALFGGATAALIATDKTTSRELPNTQDQVSVSLWASRLGALYSIAPITAGVYTIGRLTDSPRARETGRLGLEALIDAAVVMTVMKAATQRERPDEGNGEGRFWQGGGRIWNNGSSFPSGHATYGWALASVFAHEFHDKKWVPVVAYGLATTVSASRFAGRKHFASDVVLGGGIGWFIGHYVYGKRHDPTLSGRRDWRDWLSAHVEIQPSFAPRMTPRGPWDRF